MVGFCGVAIRSRTWPFSPFLVGLVGFSVRWRASSTDACLGPSSGSVGPLRSRVAGQARLLPPTVRLRPRGPHRRGPVEAPGAGAPSTSSGRSGDRGVKDTADRYDPEPVAVGVVAAPQVDLGRSA